MSEPKVIYLPIEGYEERYTNQLDAWIVERLKKNHIPYLRVCGKAINENKISTGQVLDGYGRPYYCLTQLAGVIHLMKMGDIKPGDNIFMTDIWTFGLEALPYVRTITQNKINIYGFNCAGTFEKKDFLNLTGMTPWAKHIERGWFKAVDGVFFASQKLMDMAFRSDMFQHLDVAEKVHLTGLATNTKYIRKLAGYESSDRNHKENIIVFPHRLDAEKRLDMFLKLAQWFHYREWRFIITSGRKSLYGTSPSLKEIKHYQKSGIIEFKLGLSKETYYKLLRKSKIIFSSAEQDTVGNAMLEAISLGCTPVATDNVSYQEYLPKEFIYEHGNLQDAICKVTKYMEHPVDCYGYIKKYDRSIDRMLKVMGYPIKVDKLATVPKWED